MSIKKEDDSQKTVKEVVDNFKSLLEKVQGICFNNYYENHNWLFSKPLVTSMAHVLTPDVKVVCLTLKQL